MKTGPGKYSRWYKCKSCGREYRVAKIGDPCPGCGAYVRIRLNSIDHNEFHRDSEAKRCRNCIGCGKHIDEYELIYLVTPWGLPLCLKCAHQIQKRKVSLYKIDRFQKNIESWVNDDKRESEANP